MNVLRFLPSTFGPLRAASLALAATTASAAQQYGIETPTAIGPYLNGAFPDATPGAAEQYDLVPAYPALSFREPLVITPHPNEATMFVATREGRVFSFDDDQQTTTMSTFLDLRDRCAVVWDGGFLGFVPHPNFGIAGAASSQYVYAYYCYTPTGSYPSYFANGFFNVYLRLSRFTVPTGASAADPSSEQVMMQLRLYNGSHRGGHIAFGPDGFLYVPIGDQFQYEPAQDIAANLEGGVHRLDVDMDAQRSHAPVRTLPQAHPEERSGVGYWIPNDNPFVDPGGSRFEEYWSLGHRNPHRMSFDSVTGELWIGEVGENHREELNLVERGGNYGWPFREGFLPGPRTQPPTFVGTLTDPELDFVRSEAIAIIGGYVYRGAAHPGLYGRYVCADYGRDRLYAVDFDGQSGTYTKTQIGAVVPGEAITFGESRDGELYIGRQSISTTLFKLQGRDPAPEPPALLSTVGAFVDLATLQPAPGLLPYDLNAPFWSDGALKSRWVAVPNDGAHDSPGEQVVFDARGKDWAFPPGSVAVKHFELVVDESDPTNRRRLETRFTVFTEDGSYGVSYHWREDGSDADLASDAVQEEIEIATETGPRLQTWTFPGRQDCGVCHAPETGGALGLRTHQLNRDFLYPGSNVVDNQLRTWNHLGIFAGGILEPAIASLPMAAGLDDPIASRDLKARSYLDTNCSHCHRPDSGTRAVFDARFATPLYATDLLFGTVSNDLGVAGAQVVAPRRAHQSIALMRTNALGGIAMPPLAKAVIDDPGVALLTDWIRNLEASEHRILGNSPERLPSLDVWQSNLVINKTDVVTNQSSGPLTMRIESFRFWASADGAPITPFLVTVTGVDTFQVRSIGSTRAPGEYSVGHNALPFVDGPSPTVTILPGESIAFGFLDAAADGSGSGGGSIVPFCLCNGADDVWITGGPTGGESGSVATGSQPTPGGQTLTGLARDYAFSVDIVVLALNTPPTFGALPDQAFDEGADVTFGVMANDVPGDILVYTAAGLPQGLGIDPETGIVAGVLGVASEGTYPITVTASDGRAEGTGTFDLIVGAQPYAELFAVIDGQSSLPGAAALSPSDVVRLDLSTGDWSLHFDGSDVGVTVPISGLHVESSGDMWMSFERDVDLPGLTGGPTGTLVEPVDVVRFRPTTTGATTTGTFEFVFDGSDLSFLHDVGASLDAVTRLSDGRLAFSTRGRATYAGVSVRDQDLVAFTGTLGASTAGSVAVVFRGSDIELGARAEDLDAVSVDPIAGRLLFSVREPSTARGTGRDRVELGAADVAAFDGSLQLPTAGSLTSQFRAPQLGLPGSGLQLRALSVR